MPDTPSVQTYGLTHVALAVRDPRRAVDERYQNREQYLALILKAANELVEKGYVLQEDVPRIVEQAGTRWDYVTAHARTQ